MVFLVRIILIGLPKGTALEVLGRVLCSGLGVEGFKSLKLRVT